MCIQHVDNFSSAASTWCTRTVFNVFRKLWPRFLHEFWINSICASRLIPNQARFLFLRLAGLQLRRGTVLHGVEWFGSGRVTFERGVTINRGVVVNHSGGLYMGENSGLGPGTLVITATHQIGPSSKRWGDGTTSRVVIGRGVWVGANVTILPGVRIGDGCIIGAGSVVSRDCVPHTIYAGVPARPVRELTPTP